MVGRWVLRMEDSRIVTSSGLGIGCVEPGCFCYHIVTNAVTVTDYISKECAIYRNK
jgi:hypothetical protein